MDIYKSPFNTSTEARDAMGVGGVVSNKHEGPPRRPTESTAAKKGLDEFTRYDMEHIDTIREGSDKKEPEMKNPGFLGSSTSNQ